MVIATSSALGHIYIFIRIKTTISRICVSYSSSRYDVFGISRHVSFGKRTISLVQVRMISLCYDVERKRRFDRFVATVWVASSSSTSN
mmetsp:Transcript_121299/g.247750  ORF Transcript_121299/g.247750 Transcript_121299/m.247750 type:complete len:88 (-) Transcript_121299:448-711(-)